MIITLTLNPSLDRTLEVDRLERGEVNRAAEVTLEPGGKGVNVSRAVVAHGGHSVAVLPVAGTSGQLLVGLLESSGVAVTPVLTAGRTRSNVSLVEPDGTTTKVNEPGVELSQADLQSLTAAVVDVAERGDWVVLAGSLPPGAPGDVYALLIEALHRKGSRVALDTSGPAFAAALAAGPDLVKPNAEELAEATGSALLTLADVVAAAAALRVRGAGAVLASLGSRGALLADAAGGTLHGAVSLVRPRSTVGAGDALLAGFVAAGGSGPEALSEGLRWAGAAVALPGSAMPTAVESAAVQVHLSEHVPHALALEGSH